MLRRLYRDVRLKQDEHDPDTGNEDAKGRQSDKTSTTTTTRTTSTSVNRLDPCHTSRIRRSFQALSKLVVPSGSFLSHIRRSRMAGGKLLTG
ncbi:uncharacterized protein LOC116840739 isoform X6 [Odontomachus brunneus]|uniref:uncharacterized protein LOC116840739 isoform X6 n=1 Tax=Odontomachus brunneus TaxID=486640 RepID=UPI0013F2358C|nr:uncharacterized protein LOC116840739 isoform X6 [Odontomachus brunneus]